MVYVGELNEVIRTKIKRPLKRLADTTIKKMCPDTINTQSNKKNPLFQ